jgi:hypothetical protein
MSITISDHSMVLEINGAIVAAATECDGGWRVGGWPRLLDRNQAITALTIAELLRIGVDIDDPVVTALRAELVQ